MVAFSFQNVSPSAATVDGLPFPRTYTTELRWYLLARTMQQPPRVAGTSMVSRVPKGHGILSYNGRTTVIPGISLAEVASPTVSERTATKTWASNPILRVATHPKAMVWSGNGTSAFMCGYPIAKDVAVRVCYINPLELE